MSNSVKADLTLPPDWQWVTRVHDLARGHVVCKLWWRNGVPDFRVTVSKDPDGLRAGCIAMVDIACGRAVTEGSTKRGKAAWTLNWAQSGALEDLPHDPLAAAAVVELEISDYIATRHMPKSGWLRRWPECQGRHP